ncbi:Transcription elongation factor TFIIS like [Actinidia chinensis var. chinensis]|uniref:Transcription elongation factor n=1 Tax=Actinidia chinensis var. chinensis TaxID=1590841 RepID=A0A2R6PLQ7_ACTCC|nr:Transcription elongation factor TFIIS like [Actinidia chinensis var. chinensis]
MEKELIERFEAVKKAAAAVEGVDSSAEEERCIDALKELKKFPVNYQILLSTQVGKHLRHLTKHPSKKIQAVALNLVNGWKSIVLKETIKTQKNGSLDNKDSVKAQHVNADSADFKKVQKANSVRVEKVSVVKIVKHEKIDQSGALKPEKIMSSETFSAEKKVEHVGIQIEEKQTSDVMKPTPPAAPLRLSSVIKCNDAVRDKVRELLSGALQKVSNEADEDIRDEVNDCDPFRVAASVESALFKKWGQSTGPQKFKYRSIMFNIKDSKNPDFRRKVLLGHVKPERILEMSPAEMASNQRQLENEKIKKRALFECERAGAPKATTDQFRCSRCGKKETTYHQMQTRSADEPMTTFVTCVNCGKNWKFC